MPYDYAQYFAAGSGCRLPELIKVILTAFRRRLVGFATMRLGQAEQTVDEALRVGEFAAASGCPMGNEFIDLRCVHHAERAKHRAGFR